MPRRLRALFVAFVALWLAAPAAAQTGRASGVILDNNGKPIRSATIRAENPNAYPNQITSTSDAKGRWAMIGLTVGQWQFVAEAPGFVTQGLTLGVRTVGTPGVTFTMVRDIGPLPDALDRDIANRISEANTLRDQGRLDQAIAAYHDIHNRNRKLTAIHLLLADAYRRKAAQATDPAARRGLLDQAASAYGELLKTDTENEHARAELASVRGELSSGATNR